MPNWCNNSITITGPKNKIEALWIAAKLGKDCSLLNAMVPMPEELVGTVADGGDGPDWYNWRISNWGTKWDVELDGLEFIDHGDGTAEIDGYFDSAWASPVAAYAYYFEANDDVQIEAYYDEMGSSCVGSYTSEDGDESYDYSEATSTTVRDIVPDYLVEYYDLEERLKFDEEFDDKS
jgi:hypothetical protein